MNIRKMEETDINYVYELIEKNLDGIMSEYHSKNVIEMFKNHNNPDSLRNQMKWKEIFVIENGKEIIATGALANFGSNDLPKYSISNFYIKLEYHFKGIGKKLFSHLLDLAKTKNVSTLHVPSSRNAIRFYEKMGFTEEEIQNDSKDEITCMTMNLP